MALTTANDLAMLTGWNLLTNYRKNKQSFVNVGKIVYQALNAYSANPPSGPNDVELPLTKALQSANVFKTVCAAKHHARSSYYPTFASALARHMLDNEWTDITQP